MQREPGPVQAGPPPHVHSPVGEQASAGLPQFTHSDPATPQLVRERVRQVTPAQQPEGHEAASQTHPPPSQRDPAGHGFAMPHPQVPSARQLSDVVVSHAMQVEPPVAQAATVGGSTQLEPEQHPVEHELESQAPPQTPPVHAAAPQSVHEAPPEPHCADVVPARQVVPSQQPAHEVPSQMHAPLTQRWPVAQGDPVPQRQAPPVQVSVSSASHAMQAPPPEPHASGVGIATQLVPEQQPPAQVVESHTQAPIEQRCPAEHGGPLPHAQSPAGLQRSDVIGSHATQALPPVPHVVMPDIVQTSEAVQQPDGQDVPSHTHIPPAQRWPVAQGGPDPQEHEPPVQPSASIESQAMHAIPLVPQDTAVGGVVQVAPAQHPPEQELGVHEPQIPPVQPLPMQFSQAEPPTPHEVSLVPARHAPP